MTKKRTISYLAFAMILCLGAVGMAVSPVQARYTNVVGWRMELKQEAPAVQMTSDVLDSSGSLVRLTDMYVDEEPRDVLVNLEVEGGTVSGGLDCGVSNGYLTAECLEVAQEDASPCFTIRLTPTEAALELTEKVDTTIEVVWDSKLWARLAVTLLPLEVPEAFSLTEEELSEEESTEPEETEAPLPEAVNFLSCMSGFDQKEYLALTINVPEQCDRLVLDLDDGEFPAFTRYSTDGGENFTMLYDRAWIVLEPRGEHVISVLLDLEQTELFGEEITLSLYAYYGDVFRGVATAKARILDPIPELTQGDKPIILSKEAALVLNVPNNLGGAELSFYLRRLDGSTDEIPTIAVDPENGQVYIEAVGTDHRAKAGTYLLDLNWTYQGVTAASREIAFYVNYTPCVQEEIPSEPEQTETDSTQGTEESQTPDPTQAATTGGSES